MGWRIPRRVVRGVERVGVGGGWARWEEDMLDVDEIWSRSRTTRSSQARRVEVVIYIVHQALDVYFEISIVGFGKSGDRGSERLCKSWHFSPYSVLCPGSVYRHLQSSSAARAEYTRQDPPDLGIVSLIYVPSLVIGGNLVHPAFTAIHLSAMSPQRKTKGAWSLHAA